MSFKNDDRNTYSYTEQKQQTQTNKIQLKSHKTVQNWKNIDNQKLEGTRDILKTFFAATNRNLKY